MRTIAALLFLATAGCVHALEAEATQANPLSRLKSAEDQPVSEPLYIYIRYNGRGEADAAMDPSYLLQDSAQFAVVNRDRVRFHVRLVQSVEEVADTKTWTAWLEDDTGRRLSPESRELPRLERIGIEWRRHFDPGIHRIDHYKVIPSIDVYMGVVDYVFLAKDLMAPDRHSLTLVLRRGDQQYRYTWTFSNEAFGVKHYGITQYDVDTGVIIVPGPYARVAASKYEGEEWSR